MSDASSHVRRALYETHLEQAATNLDQAAGNAPAESEAREAVNALALLTRLATTGWILSWGAGP